MSGTRTDRLGTIRGAALAALPAFAALLLWAANPVSALSSACSGQDTPITDANIGAAESSFRCLINVYRTDNGRQAVSGDPRLDRAATDHSQDMVDRGYFSHQSPEGTWHWDRMEAAGFPGNSTGNGENLGCGAAPVSPFDIFVTWQRSDSHNRNMLMADWRVAGIGVVASDACSGGYGATVTSLFATSPGDAIECGSETAALAQAKRKVAAAKRAKARAASAKRRATTRLARRKAARRLRAKRVALKRAVNTKRAARQALAECRGD